MKIIYYLQFSLILVIVFDTKDTLLYHMIIYITYILL